jgi:hypothetical protein
VRTIYVSSRAGMLVARLDAIDIELCASRGPVETTRVSSARDRSGCVTATPHSAAMMLLVSVDSSARSEGQGSVVNLMSR